MFLGCLVFLFVHCCLVVTCWERADLSALFYVMFYCFCNFPMWYPESGLDCIVSWPLPFCLTFLSYSLDLFFKLKDFEIYTALILQFGQQMSSFMSFDSTRDILNAGISYLWINLTKANSAKQILCYRMLCLNMEITVFLKLIESKVNLKKQIILCIIICHIWHKGVDPSFINHLPPKCFTRVVESSTVTLLKPSFKSEKWNSVIRITAICLQLEMHFIV